MMFMIKNLNLVFIAVTMLLSSCSKENEEPKSQKFAIFIETVCEQESSILCVSEEEFRRVQKIFADYENGPDLDCWPITVTDLEGSVHEGFLRGLTPARDDIPCVQQANFEKTF